MFDWLKIGLIALVLAITRIFKKPKLDWDKINQEIDQLEKEALDIDIKVIKIQEKLEEIKVILG